MAFSMPRVSPSFHHPPRWAFPPSLAAKLTPYCSFYSWTKPSIKASVSPRHLLSIADLTNIELKTLIRRACFLKQLVRTIPKRSGLIPRSIQRTLTGQCVAMMFSKRSTRTRVSTEAAVVAMGGHPMFLGKDDIQLGVRRSNLPSRSN